MGSRIAGIIIILISLATFIIHVAKQGQAPHDLWVLIAGVALLFGLWLALPKNSERRK